MKDVFNLIIVLSYFFRQDILVFSLPGLYQGLQPITLSIKLLNFSVTANNEMLLRFTQLFQLLI